MTPPFPSGHAYTKSRTLPPKRLIDASSYGNGGSYPRGVRVEHGSPLDHPGTGYGDTAVMFLGTGAARVPATDNLQALGSGDLSLELWLRPASTPRGVPMIAQTDGNGGPWRDGLPPLRFGILLADARTIAFRLRLQKHPYDNDGTEFPLGPIRDVELRAPLRAGPDGWTHVVATHSADDGATGGNGGKMRIYVNGVLAATKEERGQIPDSPPTPVWIGGLPAAHRFFKGALDEVALYLNPLNTQRVQLHSRVARHGCVDITWAAERSHPLSNDDRGSHLRVRVTATNAWGHATVFTKPTATVAPEPPLKRPAQPLPNISPRAAPALTRPQPHRSRPGSPAPVLRPR